MRAYHHEDAQALTSWVSRERAAAGMSQMAHGCTSMKHFFDSMATRAWGLSVLISGGPLRCP